MKNNMAKINHLFLFLQYLLIFILTLDSAHYLEDMIVWGLKQIDPTESDAVLVMSYQYISTAILLFILIALSVLAFLQLNQFSQNYNYYNYELGFYFIYLTACISIGLNIVSKIINPNTPNGRSSLLNELPSPDYSIVHYHGFAYAIFRIFTVMALFKLLAQVDSFNRIIKSSIIPNIKLYLKWILLWFVFYLLYATSMMSLFRFTKLGELNTEKNLNLNEAFSALFLLFLFTLGVDWNRYMRNYFLDPPYCSDFSKEKNPYFLNGRNSIIDSDCGDTFWAKVLFLSFDLISTYIIFNIMIGVIVENFPLGFNNKGDKNDKLSLSLISRNHVSSFQASWTRFDKDQTGYIKTDKIISFLNSLEEPFDFKIYDSEYKIEALVKSYISQYDLAIKDKLGDHLKILNTKELKNKKLVFNTLYKELLLASEKNNNLSIIRALEIILRHTFIKPVNSFLIEEFIIYKQTKNIIELEIKLEIIINLFRNLCQRRSSISIINF